MDDELEIPRGGRRAAPKAAEPVEITGKVRVLKAIQLNSDAFKDRPQRPQKLKPGDVVELLPHRAAQLVEKGIVGPA